MSGCCGTAGPTSNLGDADRLRASVSARYAALAGSASSEAGGCCDEGTSCAAPITSGLYSDEEASTVPAGALSISLGCGNPAALAKLETGEVALDLGSGGGIDVLLTARRVGPSGFVYGLDMTDEMLELARRNAAEAGHTNVEFIKGEIEAIPLPPESVDVIISNCVVNLSPEKQRVIAEAYRVLRPGGRLAISDMVFRFPPPPELRREIALWGACVSGGLTTAEYRAELENAGFTDVEIEITRQYGEELGEAYPELGAAGDLSGLSAAFVRAIKPAA